MDKTYLLNKTMTEVMDKNNVTDIPIVKKNNKAVYTLSMLYDFWLIYAYQNDLIRDQYIYPDVVVHNLLFDLYKIYGAKGSGFLLSTFLRMLGSQTFFDKEINIDISDQRDKLRNMRMGYQIGKIIE